jgi:hypothetical protein
MLHSCFTPIALCFVYTSWHFYTFSRTNLLTRCHSASSCFLLFLCFRKVTEEILLELDETKAKVPIYLTRRWSPKERRRGARRQPHHRVARATPWPRQQVVWAPGPPSDIATSRENLICGAPVFIFCGAWVVRHRIFATEIRILWRTSTCATEIRHSVVHHFICATEIRHSVAHKY